MSESKKRKRRTSVCREPLLIELHYLFTSVDIISVISSFLPCFISGSELVALQSLSEHYVKSANTIRTLRIEKGAIRFGWLSDDYAVTGELVITRTAVSHPVFITLPVSIFPFICGMPQVQHLEISAWNDLVCVRLHCEGGTVVEQQFIPTNELASYPDIPLNYYANPSWKTVCVNSAVWVRWLSSMSSDVIVQVDHEREQLKISDEQTNSVISCPIIDFRGTGVATLELMHFDRDRLIGSFVAPHQSMSFRLKLKNDAPLLVQHRLSKQAILNILIAPKV